MFLYITLFNLLYFPLSQVNIQSLLGTPSEREPLKPLPLVTRLFIPFQDDSTTIQPQQRDDSNDDSIEDAKEANTEDQRPGYYFSETEIFLIQV